MPRKRIADQEPAVSADGAAAAPAKAPAKAKATAANKARAPRASATAVTHRHKKNATTESTSAVATVEEDMPVGVAATPAAIAEPATFTLPSSEEIARLAYSLWESRGYRGGSPEDDWFTAERMLLADRGGH
jgi:hypothetical protein